MRSTSPLRIATHTDLQTSRPRSESSQGIRAQFERALELPVTVSDLLDLLQPPRHFEAARFANFIADIQYPSQTEAVETLKQFIAPAEQSWFGLFRKSIGKGLYLDGGFGVGKTHLLASAYHAFQSRKAWLSFQELMFLVGLQRLDRTIETLKEYRLLTLDEFELDDPANTRIASTLLTALLASGVRVITTSNTPPAALGVGRFSTQDFVRELSGLADSFQSIRIDGDDYRQTHKPVHHARSWYLPNTQMDDEHALVLGGNELSDLLARAHPIRVRKALAEIGRVVIENLEPFSHPHQALRFVYFVDKIYDNEITIAISSAITPFELFPGFLRAGGDNKKYSRATSRLVEMTNGG